MKDSKFSTKKLTYLAMLIACCVIGRSVFQSIPNVQPVTDIIIFTTIFFSFWEGSIVAVLTILITNMYMGMGLWTIFQIISYLVIILIAYILKFIPKFKKDMKLQAIYSLFAGYIYGIVISIFSVLSFSGIENFPKKFILYYINGFSFDTMHAIGNFILYLTFIPIFKKLETSYFNKEK